MIGRLRWVGLAGTGLLAAGGLLSGAGPGPAPASQSEALWGGGAGFRIGLLGYLAGLLLVSWAWWRIGDALRAGARPGLRWVLVTGAVWAAPLLVTPPLGSRDVYAYACQGAVWLDGHHPYQVGPAAGGCPWLAAVPPLWQETTAPYGPLALAASAVAVGLARALATGTESQLLVAVGGLRMVAVAGALLMAAALPRLARAGRVDPAGAAWLGLVTPLVAIHLVAGGHHDALVAGLVVAGLGLAAGGPPAAAGPARGGPPAAGGPPAPGTPDRVAAPGPARAVPPAGALALAGAGLALGLAAAVKVTAVAALPFAVLLAAGSARARRPGLARGGGLAAAAGAGFAGPTLLTGLGTGWTGALAGAGELAQWSSPPTGLGMAAGYLLRGLGVPGGYDAAVSVARGIGLAALVVVSVGLLVRAGRRAADPRAVVVAAGLVLAAVVLLGPVVYPWYAVVPLAVLAASVRDRRGRWWLALATLVLTGLVLPSGLGVPVLTKLPGALLMAVLVGLAGWWWLRRRQPTVPAGPAPASELPDRPARRGRPGQRPGPNQRPEPGQPPGSDRLPGSDRPPGPDRLPGPPATGR
jgi:hypothetical protein